MGKIGVLEKKFQMLKLGLIWGEVNSCLIEGFYVDINRRFAIHLIMHISLTQNQNRDNILDLSILLGHLLIDAIEG